MKYSQLLQVFGFLLAFVPVVTGQQVTFKCLQNLTISVYGGGTEAYNCTNDGNPDVIRFRPSSYATPIYFLVTDEDNIIRKINNEPRIDFEDLGPGNFRVWALSFLGEFTGEVGQNASTAELASICYELSDNFVPVYNIIPDGGTVATTEGETTVYTCTQDGNPDEISFGTTSPDPLYAYAVTTADNRIIEIVTDGNSYDFEGMEAGTCHVWGVSYIGNITAQPGDDITEAVLADGCADLSENFVEVIKTIPDGGTVSLTEGGTEGIACLNEEEPAIFTFGKNTSSQAFYRFLTTDENNIILAFLEGDELDVSALEAGVCRVWGLSYTGTITAQPGDNAAEVPLTDDCYDLSDNFVTITKKDAEGGQISILPTGVTDTVLCVADGQADLLAFGTDATDNESYTYLITDENNIILDFAPDGSYDFEGTEGSSCRVWGLAFSGNLTAQPGDDAAAIALSDECYQLSDNFVIINRIALDGAMVSIDGGTTDTLLCYNDPVGNLLTMVNTSTAPGIYNYLVTDENNVILLISENDVIDFSQLPTGISRVWGLNFTGNLTATIGDNAAEVLLSDECYDLSNNFVTVNRREIAGGSVSIDGGATDTTLCVADGQPDLLVFDAAGTSGDDYIFVVTDENNIILDFAIGGSYDFEGSGAGLARVWGLAFTGNLTAQPGDNAAEVPLADECFQLSDNFVTINRIALDAGMVTTDDGLTDLTVCFGPPGDITLTFTNNSTSGGSYYYLVTDQNNIIIAISEDGMVNYEQVVLDTTRVWGVNFTGNFLAMVGNNAAEMPLSDECYDLSDDFVTVVRKSINGGSVSISGDGTDTTLCVADGQPDRLSFSTSAVANESYTFLITDENNVILDFAAEGEYDFEGSGAGMVRVWGLAYSGNLTAQPGDNAAEVALADECFQLSDNFVTIDRIVTNGGALRLADGGTEAVLCLGDMEPDTLSPIVETDFEGDYVFLVTDTNNVVLRIETGPDIAFGGNEAGVDRIWGLAFTGNLTVMVGDNAAEVSLSDECYSLSDNAILVSKRYVDGGTVSLVDGSTEAFACSGDGEPDELTFTATSNSDAPYAYIITDTNDIIIVILIGNSLDFDVAPAGVCRSWGLSYTGNLTPFVGVHIDSVALSDECYELSENFVRIRKEAVDGGSVRTIEGMDMVTACPGNGQPDIVQMETTGTSTGAYVYVVTDTNNVIEAVTDQSIIDFEDAGEGVSRIWGLAYTGNLLANVGDNAAEVPLSDECFNLSDTYVTVVREIPDGGTVSTVEGDTSIFLCPDDEESDLVRFSTTSTHMGSYAYLVTDTANLIVAVVEGDAFDFSDYPVGFYRVWGLAYRGNLTAMIGDDAANTPLADDCFELSANFIDINRVQPAGGTVATTEGDTEVNICPGDGNPDVLRFSSDGTSGQYAYLVTDEMNVILAVVETDSFDFDSSPPGVCRVWGLAYTGNLTAQVGDNAAEAILSDGCFALSGNFITVIRAQPVAGTVSIANSGMEIVICSGDGQPDLISFKAEGASRTPYLFLVTDEQDALILAIEGTIDFDTLTVPGNLHVYGMAYTGNPTLMPGTVVTEATLSDDCFDLSTNFVSIERSLVSGGQVSSSLGDGRISVCAGDGTPDFVTFFNNSLASDAEYRYVITTDNNTVLVVLPGDQQNFENTGFDILRTWGISYTGTLSLQAGQDITQAVISDGCYALSENYITVIQDQPEAGSVLTADGETTVEICIGLRDPVLALTNTSTSLSNYAYLLTDPDNVIVVISEEASIDFTDLPNGDYRIWGLSYTGVVNVGPGDDVDEAGELASSCYELTSDFIRVSRGGPVDGGSIQTLGGQTMIEGCSQNNVPELLILETTSSSLPANYRYVITDTNNLIIIPDIEGSIIDFDGAAPGVYRVWGVSFTGEFNAAFGMNVLEDELSTECSQASANPVEVRMLGPLAGTIATVDGIDDAFTPADCGGEVPDPVLFTNTGTPVDGSSYAYLITLRDTVVAVIEEGEPFSFADLFCGESYEVTGMAYSGDLPDLIGADIIQDILFGDLFSGCVNLSTNSIAVNPAPGIQSGQPDTDSKLADWPGANPGLSSLALAPNPAHDYLLLSFEWQQFNNTTAQLEIFNAVGQRVQQQLLPASEGLNQQRLDISRLHPGIYTIHLRSGNYRQAIRFMKQ